MPTSKCHLNTTERGKRIYREQVVDVDDHKRKAVKSGFLLNQLVFVKQAADVGVLAVTPRTRPSQRRRRRPVARCQRGAAAQAVDVEQRRSEADRQVAGRHLRHQQALLTSETGSNWLLFLRVMQENKTGCFLLNTV